MIGHHEKSPLPGLPARGICYLVMNFQILLFLSRKNQSTKAAVPQRDTPETVQTTMMKVSRSASFSFSSVILASSSLPEGA